MSDVPSDSLDAGRVGRAHGLDGSFYVTGARPRLLTVGTAVTVGGRSARIVRRAGLSERPIVRLETIDSRTAAEALRGQVLSVHAAVAPELAPGEWWAHQLEGCTVTDGERQVGVVRRLLELPSCEALEVQRARDADVRVQDADAQGATAGEQGDGAGARVPDAAAQRTDVLLVPMVSDAIRSVDVSERRIDVDMEFLGEPWR
ncbi:MAG TPA: hypothetical protein VLJ42_13930 [Solirubrobacteraceae bacterium]|nr:hypothetical protein [Solirubrobacteraceae bacterium]